MIPPLQPHVKYKDTISTEKAAYPHGCGVPSAGTEYAAEAAPFGLPPGNTSCRKRAGDDKIGFSGTTLSQIDSTLPLDLERS